MKKPSNLKLALRCPLLFCLVSVYIFAPFTVKSSIALAYTKTDLLSVSEVSSSTKDPEEVEPEEVEPEELEPEELEPKGERSEAQPDSQNEKVKQQAKRLSRTEREKKKNAEAHSEVLGKYGVYPDKELQAYVNEVGQKVAAQAGSETEFVFTVVDDNYGFRAETRPGGYIYISLKALHLMTSEAELAFVLGHEIAHNTQNHLTRRKATSTILSVLSQLVAVMTRNDFGLLTQDLGSKLAIRYGQNDELEADRFGALYMSRAGYRPEGANRGNQMLKSIERFQILKTHRAGIKIPESSAVRTHPPNWRRGPKLSKFIDDELEQLRNPVNETKVSSVENEAIYLSMLEGTRYGKKNRFGLVRKNTLYFPVHGFKLKVPQEWEYKDGRGGGILVNGSRDSFVKVGVYPLSNLADLKAFAEDELKIEVREATELTISNRPAYLGIADQSSGFFGSGPARFVLIKDSSNQKVFVLGGYGKNDLRKIKDDRTYISTIFSFDFMTLNDYRKAKPLKIKIIEADQQTTMESLAAASPIGLDALDELRLLNGLYPASEPRSGQLLKIIE